MKKRGRFYYRSDRCLSHEDDTIILCTASTIHGKSFSGVVVRAGNNTFLGQTSEHFTESLFDAELENIIIKLKTHETNTH